MQMDYITSMVELFVIHHLQTSGNMKDYCTGPVFTFQAEAQETPINHILVPYELLKLVISVREDNPFNTFDHHPVFCCLKIKTDTKETHVTSFSRKQCKGLHVCGILQPLGKEIPPT